MSIVTNKEEKKFLTEEESKTLKLIQSQTQSLILELGEIEMVEELSNSEQQLTKSIFEKYGKSHINPETFEISKLD